MKQALLLGDRKERTKPRFNISAQLRQRIEFKVSFFSRFFSRKHAKGIINVMSKRRRETSRREPKESIARSFAFSRAPMLPFGDVAERFSRPVNIYFARYDRISVNTLNASKFV